MRTTTIRYRLSILLACTGSLTGQAAARAQDSPIDPMRCVPVAGVRELTGRLIARPVQPADADRLGLSPTELEARRETARLALADYPLVAAIPETDETLFAVPPGTEQDVVRRLMAHGGFQYVEPDWRVFPIGCPDDPAFAAQWHLGSGGLSACDGWACETGDPSVVVAICDTGVRTTHEDLALHRFEGYNAVDQKWENSGGNIGPVGGPFGNHGTQVTGAAAANGDNAVGVSGVGWNLGHRMLRVTNDVSGSASIATLTHAARTAADVGDRVVNVSYSGVTSSSVQTTATYVRNKDAVLVWAAGNDGAYLGGDREDDLIVVGGTAPPGDVLWSSSNYGPFVDLVAPGASVLTTDGDSDSDYLHVYGTSFASPLVAGLCGLIFSIDPTFTPNEVETFLRSGCDDLGVAGVDDTFGYGRVRSGFLCTLTCPGCISGRVYFDSDVNCWWDLSEPTYAGWPVRLFDDSGNLVGVETTGGQGDYLFPVVPVGVYSLEIALPWGWDGACPALGKYEPFPLACFCALRDFSVRPPDEQKREPGGPPKAY